MSSFQPDVVSYMDSYDAMGTELIAMDAENVTASGKNYHDIFTNRMDFTKPINPKMGYAPATGYGRVEKGQSPAEIQRQMDYKKVFFPLGMGARVTLAQEDIDDATAYGGDAKKLLNATQDVLPSCRRIALEQWAAAFLTAAVQGNNLPPGMPYLDIYTADGLSFFNEAHTFKNSVQTYANIPSADLGINIAAFNTVYQIGNAIRLANGLPTVIQYDTIVCARNLTPQITQTFNSQFDPETANNAVNKVRSLVGRNGNTEIHENPYLPAGFWMAMARNMESKFYPVQHGIYKKPVVTPWEWVPTRTKVWFMFCRENLQAPNYGFGAVSSWAKIPAP